VSRGDGYARVVLGSSVPLEAVEKQLTALGVEGYEVSDGVARLRWSDAEVVIDGSRIECRYSSEEGIERLIDVLRAVYRWWLCVGCRACEANCPMNAFSVVEVDGRPRPMVTEPELCIKCGMCLRNCPVAEVFVEHVVAPLVFDDPEAWRRPTREHNIEVMKKAKKLVQQLGAAPARGSEAPKGYADASGFFSMLEEG